MPFPRLVPCSLLPPTVHDPLTALSVLCPETEADLATPYVSGEVTGELDKKFKEKQRKLQGQNHGWRECPAPVEKRF